jgi:hypothetical protein
MIRGSSNIGNREPIWSCNLRVNKLSLMRAEPLTCHQLQNDLSRVCKQVVVRKETADELSLDGRRHCYTDV